MRQYLLSGWVLLLFLAAGCEYESYREYRIPPYDGAFTWTRIIKNADWSDRLDHAALSFNGKMWVLGGFSPVGLTGDSYMEDVWNSEDGLNWTLITDAAPWLGRRGHTALVFNDGSGEAMYVIGGFVVNEETGFREYRNDVWRSVDGFNWEQVKAPTKPAFESSSDWFPRFNHGSVVAHHAGQDYMYIIAGYTQLEDFTALYASQYLDDVWRSANGRDWEKLVTSDFGIRSEHAVCVDPASGRIYMQGGRHGYNFDADTLPSAHPNPEWLWLWYTDDGINWVSENDFIGQSQGPLSRAEHQMVIWDGQLFSLPGRNSSNEHLVLQNQAYYTTWQRHIDNSWSVDSEGSDFGNRFSYATVTHHGSIWLLGGETGSQGPSNDVWHAIIE